MTNLVRLFIVMCDYDTKDLSRALQAFSSYDRALSHAEDLQKEQPKHIYYVIEVPMKREELTTL